MINRILIRTRVLQTAYAYGHKSGANLQFAEVELQQALEKTYDLYLFLLQLIPSITDKYAEILEARRNRYIASDVDRKPNTRLLDNRLSRQISECLPLASWYIASSLAWYQEDLLLRELIKMIELSDEYDAYLKAEDSYDNDRNFWVEIFRKYIAPSATLAERLEELSIYWDSSLYYIERIDSVEDPDWEALDTTFAKARGTEGYSSARLEIGAVEVVKDFVEKTLRRAEQGQIFEAVLLPIYRDEGEEKFASHLLRQMLLNHSKYQELIAEYITDKWDRERLADLDLLLMQMAVTEFFHFPSIPTHITINEYVELSKAYSTPKSSGFINGVLDSIAKALKATGKIFK
ncbi:MAG: transcription antitermination factor NusB [Porphyromonadaceae bacterium]|nr:transcription antitermination factor NusB [Porphyromonadaceae bacterium]